MNDLLSRVLQRATQPGGGLEPLRATRVRPKSVLSGAFPVEDVREMAVPARVTTSVEARIEATATPMSSAINMALEQREIVASHAARKPRVGDALTDELTDDSFRKKVAQRETAKSAFSTNGELLASVGDGKQVDPSSAHSERTETTTSRPLIERAQMQPADSSLGVDKQETSHSPEAQILPVLEISIGHIEVQAPVKVQERPRMPPFRPRVSLHDFLARSGRR